MTFKPEGIYPVVPTPFKKDETLDLESLRELIHYYIEAGVHGVFINGSVGEYHMLSDDEAKKVINTTLDEARGKTKVVSGVGTPSTKRTIEMAKYAKDAGVDGVVIVTPYFYHPTDYGLKEHFIKVARCVEIPIIIYNVPFLSGNKLNPSMMYRFAEEEYIVGVKDSSGNIFDLTETLRLTPNRISVIIGWDSLLMAGLQMGAKGGFLGSAAIAPKLLLQLYQATLDKRYEEALQLQKRVHFIMRSMFVGNFPAGVKAALNLLGLPGGYVRSPLENLKVSEISRVRYDLERAGILHEFK